MNWTVPDDAQAALGLSVTELMQKLLATAREKFPHETMEGLATLARRYSKAVERLDFPSNRNPNARIESEAVEAGFEAAAILALAGEIEKSEALERYVKSIAKLPPQNPRIR